VVLGVITMLSLSYASVGGCVDSSPEHVCLATSKAKFALSRDDFGHCQFFWVLDHEFN
jgi:hypothetical protein